MLLNNSGIIYSFGIGLNGRLGHGNKLNWNEPKIISSLLSKKVIAISWGRAHNLVLVSNRDIDSNSYKFTNAESNPSKKNSLYSFGIGRDARLGFP